MSGINKVILVGNLGADPEVRALPSGDAVANIRIATSESWKDKNTGEKQERTEWHTVVFFGKLAEIVQQYARKGSKLYVEGKLRTRKWQDKAGQERYSTEIVVDSTGTMQMLDSRNTGAGAESSGVVNPGPGEMDGYAGTAPAPTRNAPRRPSAAPDPEDIEYDIPF